MEFLSIKTNVNITNKSFSSLCMDGLEYLLALNSCLSLSSYLSFYLSSSSFKTSISIGLSYKHLNHLVLHQLLISLMTSSNRISVVVLFLAINLFINTVTLKLKNIFKKNFRFICF